MERRIDRLEKYMIIKKLNDNQVTKDCDLSVGLLNQAKRGKSDKGSDIFLFAFALADVVLELGTHGLCLFEDGADVGLDGHFLLPAAHGTEWLWGGQFCGSAGVCRTVENGM